MALAIRSYSEPQLVLLQHHIFLASHPRMASPLALTSQLLAIQSVFICRFSIGRVGILEVPGCPADPPGGADQHAALQDDRSHSQDSTVQAGQGK
jgi:hypothetical protein